VLTQPRKPLHHVFRYGRRRQKRRNQVHDEEQQPTGDEPADHYGQRLRRFILALQRNPAIVTSAQTDIIATIVG